MRSNKRNEHDYGKKVTAIYYSATGNSKVSACTIAEELSKDYQQIDVTKYNSITEDYHFNEQDVVIFSAPVYAGRVYEGAMVQFSHFYGKNTKCIVTVTYGNRHYDDALLELSDTLKEQGFIPMAAALVGRHTYGEIQVDCPNEADKQEDRTFGDKIVYKLTDDTITECVIVPGNSPYKEGGTGGKFRPETDDRCIDCGLCVRECPQGAIAEDYRTIDTTKCIACFRCIRICLVNAKNMDHVEAYQNFAKDFTQKLSVRRENEYLL